MVYITGFSTPHPTFFRKQKGCRAKTAVNSSLYTMPNANPASCAAGLDYCTCISGVLLNSFVDGNTTLLLRSRSSVLLYIDRPVLESWLVETCASLNHYKAVRILCCVDSRTLAKFLLKVLKSQGQVFFFFLFMLYTENKPRTNQKTDIQSY